jgi:hypothetical protein
VCSAKALALFAAIRRIRRIKTIKDCGCSGGLFWLKWVAFWCKKGLPQSDFEWLGSGHCFERFRLSDWGCFCDRWKVS